MIRYYTLNSFFFSVKYSIYNTWIHFRRLLNSILLDFFKYCKFKNIISKYSLYRALNPSFRTFKAHLNMKNVNLGLVPIYCSNIKSSCDTKWLLSLSSSILLFERVYSTIWSLILIYGLIVIYSSDLRREHDNAKLVYDYFECYFDKSCMDRFRKMLRWWTLPKWPMWYLYGFVWSITRVLPRVHHIFSFDLQILVKKSQLG